MPVKPAVGCMVPIGCLLPILVLTFIVLSIVIIA